jgi:hypothetical protein
VRVDDPGGDEGRDGGLAVGSGLELVRDVGGVELVVVWGHFGDGFVGVEWRVAVFVSEKEQVGGLGSRKDAKY